MADPAPGEVRVRVRAASVNGFDLAVLSGMLEGVMEHRYPVVLGKDFAGTVDALGEGVSGFAVGDRVFGVVMSPFIGPGSFAEYVNVQAGFGLAPLPDDIDFATGAVLGLASATALTCLAAAEVVPGTRVLVAGATGGVGTALVQLAAAEGAEVIATARTADGHELVAGLGAVHTVDRTLDVAAEVLSAFPDGIDVIMHLAGDPQALAPALRSGGLFVSPLVFSPDQLVLDDAVVIPIQAFPDEAILSLAADHHVSGRTRATVMNTYPLHDAPDALAAFAGGTLGKLVILTD